MRLTARTRKILHLVALPLALACIATILSYQVVEQHDSLASLVDVLDIQRAIALRGPVAPNPHIEVITFNEASLKKLGLVNASAMPRAKHAELITKLDNAGARVALYDVQFDAAAPGEKDAPGTAELRKALAHLKNLRVTLPTGTGDKDLDKQTPIVSGPMDKIALSSDYASDRVRVATMDAATSKVDKLGLGAFPIELDTNTGKTILYGPVSAALQYFGIPASSVRQDTGDARDSAGSLNWSIDESKAVEVRWTRAPTPFRHIDFLDALALSPEAARKEFAGKIVIVGNAGASGDTIETKPFGTMHGVDWVAQMMNTVMLSSSEQVSRSPDLIFYGFGILVCFAGFLATRARKPIVTAAAIGLVIGGCYLGQFLAALRFGWRFGVTGPILALSGTTLVALLVGRYWTDDLNLSRQSDAEDVTILFLDIRSSTILLHDIGRKEFLRLFSDLMARCAPILKEYGGDIEHLLGDGFMAVFRSDAKRHHALRCADCCEKLIQATEALARKEGLPLKVALGFESGIIGGGYVNEGGRKGWSSTGTTINLAQRLQTLCGQHDMRVAVGPVARKLIADERSCEMITKAYVKGFDEEVEVCSLR